MHVFISSQSRGLRGLAMPIHGQDILDSKFADDMMLYMDGTLTNLQQVEGAWYRVWVHMFCIASGAKLNRFVD